MFFAPDTMEEIRTLRASSYKHYLQQPGTLFTNQVTTWRHSGATIGFSIDVQPSQALLSLDYTYQESQRKAYTISLVTKPSNLGTGQLWYFVCPTTGKLAKKLYLINGIFQHRTAARCLYFCQTTPKSLRPMAQQFRALKYLEALQQRYRKPTYRGKPTASYSHLIKLYEKASR